MKDSTTYDTTNGRVSTPLENQPVIVISKKGKRKVNPLFEELVKNIPEETKRKVEKAMTCKWLRNGDECGKGFPGPHARLTDVSLGNIIRRNRNDTRRLIKRSDCP